MRKVITSSKKETEKVCLRDEIAKKMELLTERLGVNFNEEFNSYVDEIYRKASDYDD